MAQAHISRAGRRTIVEVWPIQLNERLPVVPIPLLSGDPDVPLDLQLALTTVYDALGYDLSVDYTRPAEVPLKGEAAVWAVECLPCGRVLACQRVVTQIDTPEANRGQRHACVTIPTFEHVADHYSLCRICKA